MTEQPAVPRGPIDWARHYAALRTAASPQDAPHARQDAPQRPDAAAETPDGAGGRQTATEPLARLRRLRDQLAAEHAKAVRADQHPRPDLDHLRVTAHNGKAVGLETALFFIDHHLREMGEAAARTTANNPAASGDASDNPLRERLDEAQQNALALDQGREELFAVIRGVRAAVHVTDDQDVTDWQRGYRACSERALAALDGKEQS